MKKILILLLFMTSINMDFLFAQTNQYVWLHGLNDTGDCWDLYRQSLTPTNSSSRTYSSTTSIDSIGINVWNNSITNRKNLILIGHSMGGLVARAIENQHPNNVKGIITIGTPHEGAAILNKIDNGALTELSEKVVDKVVLNVDASACALLLTGNTGVAMTIGSAIVATSSSLKKDLILPAIDGYIEDTKSSILKSQCVKDMAVGSSYMKTIANRTVNVPILTFGCDENALGTSRIGYCA
jgi:hypothetical protein